jgi:hydroxymethylglutaryl-CoA lyase
MAKPSFVTIVEVGPRDGLQNETASVATADKVEFVNRLSASGLPVIETGAFVSPRWVPQMADSDEVFARIQRPQSTRFAALVPNLRGLDRAYSAGVREIGMFAAASETFSQKNINQSIEESLTTYREVCGRALELGIRVRGYVSTAFGCPFEGDVPPSRVAEVSEAFMSMGAHEVAISDTIGIGHPGQVPQVVEAVAKRVPRGQIALHFHDTRGMAVANVLAALDLGIETFDSSAGGLGGCPYAPGATGNLATEDLVYMLEGLGIGTGVDLDALVAASVFIESRLDHALPSRYYRATRGSRRLATSD